jgi:S1-C subfamily serine protease
VRLARPPRGLIHAGLVAAILLIAIGRREREDAPEPPPPMTGAAHMPLSPSSPFAPARVIAAPAGSETASGTAFSVGEGGIWLTARHVLDGCRQPAIVVAEGRGVAARLRAERGDIAVLTTEGGAPPLALGPTRDPGGGQLAFHPGYPQGRPGEAASRLLGVQTLRGRGRGGRAQVVLAWAEVGRTEGLRGSLAGLSGAPVLDGAGQVVGVTVAEAPRRGRIYTTAPSDMRAALAAAGQRPALAGAGEAVTPDNYGRVADSLRRDLRVVQVVCLAT